MELNFVVVNLVRKKNNKKKKNYSFCFRMWDVRWFVYPRIMNKSDNMGERDSAYNNGNYKKQTKSSLMYNWTHNVASWRP